MGITTVPLELHFAAPQNYFHTMEATASAISHWGGGKGGVWSPWFYYIYFLQLLISIIIIWKQQLQQSLVEEEVGFDQHGSTVITFSQLLINIITIWRQQLQWFLVREGGGVGSPQFYCNYLLQLLICDEQNIVIISVFPAFPDMFQPWTIDSWKKCQQCILNEEKHLSCVKCV